MSLTHDFRKRSIQTADGEVPSLKIAEAEVDSKGAFVLDLPEENMIKPYLINLKGFYKNLGDCKGEINISDQNASIIYLNDFGLKRGENASIFAYNGTRVSNEQYSLHTESEVFYYSDRDVKFSGTTTCTQVTPGPVYILPISVNFELHKGWNVIHRSDKTSSNES